MVPCKVPPELQGLTMLEQMCIARVQPIISCYRLRGGQFAGRNHCISFRQNLTDLVRHLPSLPSDCPLVVCVPKEVDGVQVVQELKLRRKRVAAALEWLRKNNPCYEDCPISDANLKALGDGNGGNDPGLECGSVAALRRVGVKFMLVPDSGNAPDLGPDSSLPDVAANGGVGGGGGGEGGGRASGDAAGGQSTTFSSFASAPVPHDSATRVRQAVAGAQGGSASANSNGNSKVDWPQREEQPVGCCPLRVWAGVFVGSPERPFRFLRLFACGLVGVWWFVAGR